MLKFKHYLLLCEVDTNDYRNKIDKFQKDNNISDFNLAIYEIARQSRDPFLKMVIKTHEKYKINCKEIMILSYALSDISAQFKISYKDMFKIYIETVKPAATTFSFEKASYENLNNVNFDKIIHTNGLKIKDVLSPEQLRVLPYLKTLNKTYHQNVITAILIELKDYNVAKAIALKATLTTFKLLSKLTSGIASATSVLANSGSTKISNL